MVSMLQSKSGISPLIATVLLIVFSVALGAVVMSWGESYIEEKAEFVSGVQETVSGCDLVDFTIIEVAGEPQICTRNGMVDIWLDNGPAVDVYSLHARNVGAQGVASVENLLDAPLLKNSAAKATFSTGNIGALRQVKLTPTVMVGHDPVVCSKNAMIIEGIMPCQ